MRRTSPTTRVTVAVAACLAATVLVSARQAPAPRAAFPARGAWPKAEPSAVGLDKAKLADAIAFAVANQNRNTRDLAVAIPNSFRSEAPYNALIGPTAPRAESNGIIIRHGKVAAEWGDTAHVDMTFSVTKTFLSTVVGLAFDRGKIKSVTDRVAGYMPKGVDLFASPHNAPITWEHLLRQTSDWSGTLWGKPDWADRPPSGKTPDQWEKREMHEPGTFYKYNDTRVNVLALSALYVLGQPLPEVLKTSIMDPIGASDTWHWEAYDNAWVEIDGRKMKSVTGGGHFGGGMFINAYDMARFGYLFLHNGKWGGTAAHFREVDRHGKDARAGQRNGTATATGTSISHSHAGRHRRAAAIPLGTARLCDVPGQRRQRHLHRLGSRHRCRRALDRQQPEPRSVPRQDARSADRLTLHTARDDTASTASPKSCYIRPALHPGALRCSSLKYSRYSRSSRLARRAHRRPRC